MFNHSRPSSPVIATDHSRHDFLAMPDKLRKQLFFSFSFFCLLQPIYSMEKDNESIFSSIFNKLQSYTLYLPFCNAVESAQKNGFSMEDCEIIKNYIIKGADPNWKIGKDDEPLLNLAIKNQNKDLFNFLLQHNADINASNKKEITPVHLLSILCDCKKLDVQIEDLVKHGATLKLETYETFPLYEAVVSSSISKKNDNLENYFNTYYGVTSFIPYEKKNIENYINCIKSLIKYHADINCRAVQGYTPLGFALLYCNKIPIKIIKELCKFKASLDANPKNGNNIFHLTVINKRNKPIKYIKPLITNARFDDLDKSSKKNVLFALWVLKYWNPINIALSNDTKLHILSKLPLSDLYPYKNLCRLLLKTNYNHILLPQVYERVKTIKQILATPNNENKTALQLAVEKFANNQDHLNSLRPFF